MHEIEELERKWRRYTLKRRIPYIAGAFLLLAALFVALFGPIKFFSTPLDQSSSKSIQTTSTKTNSNAETIESAPKTSSAETPKPSQETARTLDVEKEGRSSTEKTVSVVATPQREPSNTTQKPKKVVLAPDTAFLDHLSSDSLEKKRTPLPKRKSTNRVIREETIPNVVKPNTFSTSEKEERTIQTSSKKPTKEITDAQSRSSAKQEKVVISTQPTEKTSSIKIERKKTNNTLEYLIHRFNENRDPKLAAYIAQSFFKKGNYDETIRWSVIANSLDPADESSWILFAKAKAKLGKRDEAIKALKIYLNQYPSRKVQSYLESLEGGF